MGDKQGQIIQVEDKDMKIRFHGAGTKGGQAANHNNTLAHVTHIPSGISVLGDKSRSQPDDLVYAVSRMRMLLDIQTHGDESIFTKMENERLKSVRAEKDKKNKERNQNRRDEAKLKDLLSQPDWIKY